MYKAARTYLRSNREDSERAIVDFTVAIQIDSIGVHMSDMSKKIV